MYKGKQNLNPIFRNIFTQNKNQIYAPKWKFYSRTSMPNKFLSSIAFHRVDPILGTKQ